MHATSVRRQLQAAFLNRKCLFIQSLKWHYKPFSRTVFAPNIIPTEPSKINDKWLRKKLIFPLYGKNKKQITFFFGKYQKHFISCVENISNFTRATHSWNYWYFQHIGWNIFGIHLKKVNILFICLRKSHISVSFSRIVPKECCIHCMPCSFRIRTVITP